ncbi:MAG: leucyl/phenylalanyl-tRNA--protein transferase [Bdellovibrionaceae bacterium]|nr:leucyl/phenylalanyl-tRNA--protein transferase [Pseudobdellovibrionaceae bacterium]
MKSRFPDPRQADENGIVAIGGTLEVASLIDAYSHGIFPWPHKDYPMLWFSPEERGILFFADLHIPRSLKKWLNKCEMTVTFDTHFSDVIMKCATRKRKGQKDTWITEGMVQAYQELHTQGYAHSVECWLGDTLVGGLYGVYIGGVFSAESMFYIESGASKVCLLALIDKLEKMGHYWLDTQMVTSVVEDFGGVYISREEFLRLLSEAQMAEIKWELGSHAN